MGVRDGLGRMALAAPFLGHQILQKYGCYIIFTFSTFDERGLRNRTSDGRGDGPSGKWRAKLTQKLGKEIISKSTFLHFSAINATI